MALFNRERLYGTLDGLILKTLSWGPRHGYAVARWLEDTTRGITIEEGSLYPSLYRMEKRGWIDADWGTTELGRRARIYRLTPKGRQQLKTETTEWAAFAAAVTRVMQSAQEA